MRKIDLKLYDSILWEFKNNSKVTEKVLAEKYLVTERTIRRYVRILKDENKIQFIREGKNRTWKIL